MDFGDSPAEAAFRSDAREFLNEHASGRAAAHRRARERGHADEAGQRDWLEVSREWLRTRAEHGWAGITWPVEHGGRGGTPMQQVIYDQEEARSGVSTGFLGAALALVGPPLIRHGRPEQQQRYLASMLRGDEVWCQLFSEPAAGSDLAALRTRAVRDGDEWVVNGQKVWTSNAQFADFGILLARTDPDVPKHAGITFFVADMGAPGVEVRPLRQITGVAHFNEVFLTDVRIPHDRVVGEVGGGWTVARTTLANEAGMIGTNRFGPSFADLAAYATLSGRDRDPVVRQSLADLYVRQRILEFLGYRVRTALSQGRRPGHEGSVAKLARSAYVARLGDVGVALAGPAGVLGGADAPGDGVWSRVLLEQWSTRIGGGTEEIHRTMVGERALGLPSEPRVDRGVAFRELP